MSCSLLPLQYTFEILQFRLNIKRKNNSNQALLQLFRILSLRMTNVLQKCQFSLSRMCFYRFQPKGCTNERKINKQMVNSSPQRNLQHKFILPKQQLSQKSLNQNIHQLACRKLIRNFISMNWTRLTFGISVALKQRKQIFFTVTLP